MPRKLTHEEFMEKFYEKNKNAENIEILGEYKGNKTKIKCKCKIDSYEWEARPDVLLNGHSCPKCAGKMKLTHEEFVDRMKEINSDIEILGEYVNNKTKIKVRCKVDGYEWEATPNNLLKGQGCLKCSGKMQLTHEEFINRMNKINTDIEIVGEYVNSQTKIKCKCKIDRYEWETTPNNLLNGQGCPKCYNNRRGENKKITHEEFVDRMKEINSDIEILGEYVNNKTKIKVRCKVDGYEWEATPNNLLKGQGCLKCSGKMQLTHEEFINRMNKINTDIEIVGEYVNSQTKIKCKCKIDRYEWETTPNNLLNGHGCPKCKSNKIKKTHKEFVNELKEINENIEILGEYKGNKTKIKCKCKIDGYEWEVKPSSLLSGHGCPKCNESKGEKRVTKYLDNKNIEYERQYKFNDCRSKDKLPFDFYIPSLNIAIEYDGEYHYMIITRGKNDTYERAFNRFVGTKVRDTIKTIYCKENNIKLIRIAYWDFDNIEEILEKEL